MPPNFLTALCLMLAIELQNLPNPVGARLEALRQKISFGGSIFSKAERKCVCPRNCRNALGKLFTFVPATRQRTTYRFKPTNFQRVPTHGAFEAEDIHWNYFPDQWPRGFLVAELAPPAETGAGFRRRGLPTFRSRLRSSGPDREAPAMSHILRAWTKEDKVMIKRRSVTNPSCYRQGKS